MTTNRDKINKMTNEELAKFILDTNEEVCRFCTNRCLYRSDDCQKGILEWLNQECEDGE